MNGPNKRVEFAKVFFLGFFCAVALIALMGQHLSPASPQRIGQYQMKVMNYNGISYIHVMDTTTGAVKRVDGRSVRKDGYPLGFTFDGVMPTDIPAEKNP